MPTWRITAPRKMGSVEKGTSFIVVTRTTGEPSGQDIEEVLYSNGHKDTGGSSAISYRATGNWECQKISDDTYPAWDKQHEEYEKEKAADKNNKETQKEENKAGQQGGGAEMTFGQKLACLAIASAVDGGDAKGKKNAALTRTNRVLPKPKSVRPAAANAAPAAGEKKSLLSGKKSESIAKARPKAAASRGNVLKVVKSSGSKVKGTTIFGKSKPVAKKSAVTKSSAIKKSAIKKSATKPSVTKKSATKSSVTKKSSTPMRSAAPKRGAMAGGKRR